MLFLLACLGRPTAPSEPAAVPTEAPAPSLIGRFTLTAYPGMGAVGPGGEEPLPMAKDYTFTADSYTMDGYPPLTITGRYTVLEADGDRLKVRFTDTIFDGSPHPDQELWVELTDGGRTLQMEGMT
jgi:hypothetical protein